MSYTTTPKPAVCHIARIVLSCATPLSIKADDADPTFDTRLMRDANGLPTIPGTAIAGVLRHLTYKLYGDAREESLFGFAQGDAGQKSRLEVSFGYIHDQHNTPVQGLIDPLTIAQDPILQRLHQSQPIVRDQVRLTHKGVAADKGKMDRTLVPKGTRFSMELVYWSDKQEVGSEQPWMQLLSLLKRADFRLGGLTRRGLGKMQPESIHQSIYILNDASDQADYLQLSMDIADRTGFEDISAQIKANHDGLLTLNLALVSEDFWRIGQGDSPLGQYAKDPGMRPKTEWWIDYHKNQAKILKGKEAVVVPATAIKGALSHRLAYHYNRLSEQYIETGTGQTGIDNLAVNTLFGEEKNTKKQNDNKTHAGFVYIDDLYIQKPIQSQQMMHNAIDRFSGGTLDGALYSEELLWQTPIDLTMSIDLIGLSKLAIEKPILLKIIQAFEATVKDLCEGQLAIGAGANRGHGYLQLQKNTQPMDLNLIAHVSQNQGAIA